MSASRRADARKNRASKPYNTNGRAIKLKEPGWLGSLLGFFAGSKSPEPEPEKEQAVHAHSDRSPNATPAEVLTARGRQIIHDLTADEDSNVTAGPVTPSHAQPAYASAPPVTPVNGYTPSIVRPSPSDHIDRVTAFLHEKKGQVINEWEAEGVIAYLQKAKQNERTESFRFSASPTPARGNTPMNGTHSQPQSPQKMLPKNPNGPYRYEGSGSARPRNRFHSPSFGSPRVTTKIKLPTPETQKSDTKRRRVGEEASASSAQPVPAMTTPTRSAAPPPSPNRPADDTSYPFPVSNSASPSVNGTPSAPKVKGSRSRVTAFAQPQKPTAPANPSPLRQAWGQAESPSSSSSSPPSSGRPTKAANFMTELIKEVTPTKKPSAILNPYQTASPVKATVIKPSTKRARASPKPAQRNEKQVEPSPQAIIEATVPKGSKRSRPPPNLSQSTRGESSPSPSPSLPNPPRRSPRTQSSEIPSVNGVNGKSRASKVPPVVEEIPDDEEERHVSKKQKHSPPPTNGTSPRPASSSTKNQANRNVTVEEVEDEDRPSCFKPQHAYARPSEVVELPDTSPASIPAAQPHITTGSPFGSSSPHPQLATANNKTFGLKSTPKEPSKLRFSYQPDASPGSVSSNSTPPTPPLSAPQLPKRSSSTFENDANAKTKPALDPKAAALAMDTVSLPIFTFPLKESSNDLHHVKMATPQSKANATPISALPTFDFTPKSGSASSCLRPPAPVLAFNWAAAGIKPASKASGQDWTCSTCMCLSPTSADKCIVCEAPR